MDIDCQLLPGPPAPGHPVRHAAHRLIRAAARGARKVRSTAVQVPRLVCHVRPDMPLAVLLAATAAGALAGLGAHQPTAGSAATEPIRIADPAPPAPAGAPPQAPSGWFRLVQRATTQAAAPPPALILTKIPEPPTASLFGGAAAFLVLFRAATRCRLSSPAP